MMHSQKLIILNSFNVSNICDNKFYIYSEENTEEISKKLATLFKENLYGEITYEDQNIIEGWFESAWVFPDDLFKDFFNEFNDIYMRCLSEEYGCNYVAMNIYTDNNWLNEQTFNF